MQIEHLGNLERILHPRIRNAQIIRVHLEPAQRELSTLLDHIPEAPGQLQLPSPRHRDRLDGQNTSFALAHHNETVDDPSSFLSFLLVPIPPCDSENLLKLVFL